MEPIKGDQGSRINESHQSTQKAGVKDVQEDKASSKQMPAGDEWDVEGNDKDDTNSNNSVGIKKDQEGKKKG